MKIFQKMFVVLVLIITVVSSLPNHAAAVSAADWRAGRIIDDGIFTNANDMSVGDIQAFLSSKVPSCDTNGTQPATEYGRPDLTHAQYAAARGWDAPPYICLKDYHEVPKTSPGPGVPANNYSGSIPTGAISAAQMIYNAAQEYRINPKVLLVTIQKESMGPLTTDTWPLQKQYTYAMGAYCPDSGPGGSANCDANYAGFSIQIAQSASLMRWYLDSMAQSWWQYKKPNQVNSILWNVATTGCGAGDVYIENKATAALYTYTPYQPNAAALANMYGVGDGCSAYGNRNFWRIYSDWFGNPSGPRTVFVANNGSGVVSTSAYTTSDGIQHVITLKSNGDVLETWWGTIGGQYRLATSVVASTGAGAVASSAYTTSDGIQHVITLKSNGDVLETWWGTIGGQYRLATSVVASTGAGAVASSAYTTSDGIQHVITLKSNGDVLETWWGTIGGQYRLATSVVASTGAGAVASSAYTTSDGIQHVITLKSNGDVLETWWGTIGGQYRLATSVVASTGAGAVASSAYTTSDGIQHVITLKSNGDVLETWWGTIGGQYRLATSVVASTGAGAVASSAYTTSDGIQHVITLKSNGDVLETWWQ